MNASYSLLRDDRAAVTLSKYTSSGKMSYVTSIPEAFLKLSRSAIIASA